MKNIIKNVSPALFGIMIICFFMPFMNLRCGGQKLMSLNGIQLVTGTTIEHKELIKELKKIDRLYSQHFRANLPAIEQVEKIEPQLLPIIIFVVAIFGTCTGFIRNRKIYMLSVIISACGVATALLFKYQTDNDILKQGGGIIVVEYGFGFWLILLLLFLTIAINLYFLSQSKSETKSRPIDQEKHLKKATSEIKTKDIPPDYSSLNKDGQKATEEDDLRWAPPGYKR